MRYIGEKPPHLQRVPEGESEGAGGLVDRVVTRDPGTEHDHVD